MADGENGKVGAAALLLVVQGVILELGHVIAPPLYTEGASAEENL